MGAKNTEIVTAIVVRADAVGDADIRVRVFSESGVRTLVATGARRPNAKLKSAVQIFTLAEFTIVGQKIIGAYIIEPHAGIPHDIKKYYLACAICEVVDAIFRHVDSQSCAGGFALTVAALAALGAQPTHAKTSREVFTEYFTALLVELGYDIPADMDINTAYAHNLDVKIPHTRYYL